MSEKTAYLWGPISNFSAYLVAWLLENGWRVDLPGKSAWHITLSPLDLHSSAQSAIEKALSSKEKFLSLSNKIRLLDGNETPKGTTYDALLFCALPSNFDEPRVSRAIWASSEFQALTKRLKGVPTLIFSSLWGGIQKDGVVPEEIEFERRKSKSSFEAVCQQYELKLLECLDKQESPWHWIRLPLITGSTTDGTCINFSGVSGLFEKMLDAFPEREHNDGKLQLCYNQDASLWTLPADTAAEVAGRMIEDSSRPRICNLVSSQTVLNQEWLRDLAQLIGFTSVEASEKDELPLPGTLRSMLTDNVQVKTRSLFEVIGRYHYTFRALDKEYLEKLIEYGKKENWGHLKPPEPANRELFCELEAQTYFTQFIPEHLNEKWNKALAQFRGGLAFSIIGEEELGWQLEVKDDRAVVKNYKTEEDNPEAHIFIAKSAFGKLVKGKVPLEQALLTRAVQVKGNPWQILKVSDFFRRFLKENPVADTLTTKQPSPSAKPDSTPKVEPVKQLTDQAVQNEKNDEASQIAQETTAPVKKKRQTKRKK